MNFYNDFDRNVKLFEDAFDRDDTFKVKHIRNEHSPKLKIAVAVVNCMVSNDVVDRDVIAPLSKMRLSADIETAEREGICAHSTELQPDASAAIISLASGDCAVLIGNNPQAIIIDTKGMAQRSIDAPESEMTITGPSEGFNENIMTNLSLVKKKIMNSNLKNEFMTSGRQSNSKFCVCYIDGIARPELVERVKSRLKEIDTDYIGDTNYIAEMIRDNKSSFIKTYGKTNRPDVFAAKLMEGRIGIILNGSPTAVTLPHLFIENFQTPFAYSSLFISILIAFLTFLLFKLLLCKYRTCTASAWLLYFFFAAGTVYRHNNSSSGFTSARMAVQYKCFTERSPYSVCA